MVARIYCDKCKEAIPVICDRVSLMCSYFDYDSNAVKYEHHLCSTCFYKIFEVQE